MKTKKENGFALVAVIFALSLALLILMTLSVQTLNTTRTLQLRLNYQGQGMNAAQAGLIEGLDWFRRQVGQPVNTFNPIRNLPTTNDTDVVTNPVSLNRDYLISQPGRVWGHYELIRGTPSGTTNVVDLTQQRRGNLAGTGNVWQLQALGVAYVRNNPAVAWNVPPNLVIARRTLLAEIQRVTLNLPANAAVIIQQPGAAGANCRIGTAGNSRARVIGGAAGVGVAYVGPGIILTDAGPPPATLSGTPATSAGLNASQFTIPNVFGVSTISDLSALADISATSVAAVPNPIRTMSIILLNGNQVFNSANPLNGSGVLIVNGNLTIDGGPSAYNGIIFVTGNYLQIGPSTVNGTVMLGGAASTFTIRGAVDFAEIFHDRFILQQVNLQLANYRFSRPAYVPCNPGDPRCTTSLIED